MCKRFFLSISVLLFCLASLICGEPKAQDKTISLVVLESAFSKIDEKAIKETVIALKTQLKSLNFKVNYFKPSELEDQLKNNKVDYFIGTSGFYRRFQKLGLSGVATLYSLEAPDPAKATGAVFVVLKDSPIKNLEDLKGKSALASWSFGFSSFFTPMYEIAKNGFNEEKFFSEYKTFGPPIEGLLKRLKNKEGDVVLMRACLLEDITQGNPLKDYRVINEKKDNLINCLHSTDLYPNWTLVATKNADWRETKEITRVLLSVSNKNNFGWSVVPDFNSIDEMYKVLKRGPYEYLRVQTLTDFLYKYRLAIAGSLLFVLMLIFHCLRSDQLVKKRTKSLKEAWRKERALRRRISENEIRIEQLQKTEMINAMSSLIAHEINGPVSTIDNFCRGIRRKLELTENAPNWLNRPLAVIEKQSSKIANIVKNVRSYAKEEQVELEEILFKPWIKKYFQNLQERYPEIKFEIRVNADCSIMAHALEFEVLIENLIKNAIQASKETDQQEVSICAYTEGTVLQILIKNPVNFSSEEDLKEAITPLNSRKERGLGIGLLICRTIVEKLRGTLEFTYDQGVVVVKLSLPCFIQAKRKGEITC